VSFDDFGDVGELDAAVPDVVGVDDHRGAELAGVNAAGGVGADLLRQAALVQFLLQQIPDRFGALGCTATLWVVGRSNVRADEDVPLKRGNRWLRWCWRRYGAPEKLTQEHPEVEPQFTHL